MGIKMYVKLWTYSFFWSCGSFCSLLHILRFWKYFLHTLFYNFIMFLSIHHFCRFTLDQQFNSLTGENEWELDLWGWEKQNQEFEFWFWCKTKWGPLLALVWLVSLVTNEHLFQWKFDNLVIYHKLRKYVYFCMAVWWKLGTDLHKKPNPDFSNLI